MAPPKRELPFKGRTIDNGTRKLTDENVIVARSLVGTVTVKELAERYGVKYQTMWCAIKGITFKYLNPVYPPPL